MIPTAVGWLRAIWPIISVPVHADMPEFEVEFLDKPDLMISPIGARGIGEIGITGMAAASANAITNATGKRFVTFLLLLINYE